MSQSNQQHFFDNIARWQQSGLSQKVWCEQNQISYSSFHYWYKRFRNEQNDPQSKGEGFVQLVVQDRPAGTPWCELVFGTGQRLIFHHPVAAAFISDLLD